MELSVGQLLGGGIGSNKLNYLFGPSFVLGIFLGNEQVHLIVRDMSATQC